jgi:hypothetical protein
MNVITNNLESAAPLYRTYPRQNQAQPAYIELDCRENGELMADYSGESGNAVPAYYYHGLAYRWEIPAETSGSSLKALFADETFLALCRRILAGFEEVWDGSNYVGRYNAAATSAIEEVYGLINRTLEVVEVWSVNDWLFSCSPLSDHWKDQPLAEAVAELEAGVGSNEVVDGDIAEALLEGARIEFDYHPERLTRTHIDELLKQGKITSAEADEWVEEHDEYEANALLLAAAPDLLQALKHIMNNAPAPVGGAKLMAERAIAKAEGK